MGREGDTPARIAAPAQEAFGVNRPGLIPSPGGLAHAYDLTQLLARAIDVAGTTSQPGQLCRQTVDALLMPGDQRELTLRVEPSLPAVGVDAAKMQQALTNLIANAFKYSPAGGEVVLVVTAVASADGPAVRLSVSVQGIGMTAEQLQRACDRCYRADASGQIPGTGLELSLAKEIVGLHGGKLRLESEFGKGTTATVEVPASPG